MPSNRSGAARKHNTSSHRTTQQPRLLTKLTERSQSSGDRQNTSPSPQRPTKRDKTQAQTHEISPQMASKVVKEYLLPMFSGGCGGGDQAMLPGTGKNKSVSSGLKGSLVSQLQLCAELGQILDQSQRDNSNMQNRTQHAEYTLAIKSK